MPTQTLTETLTATEPGRRRAQKWRWKNESSDPLIINAIDFIPDLYASKFGHIAVKVNNVPIFDPQDADITLRGYSKFTLPVPNAVISPYMHVEVEFWTDQEQTEPITAIMSFNLHVSEQKENVPTQNTPRSASELALIAEPLVLFPLETRGNLTIDGNNDTLEYTELLDMGGYKRLIIQFSGTGAGQPHSVSIMADNLKPLQDILKDITVSATAPETAEPEYPIAVPSTTTHSIPDADIIVQFAYKGVPFTDPANDLPSVEPINSSQTYDFGYTAQTPETEHHAEFKIRPPVWSPEIEYGLAEPSMKTWSTSIRIHNPSTRYDNYVRHIGTLIYTIHFKGKKIALMTTQTIHYEVSDNQTDWTEIDTEPDTGGNIEKTLDFTERYLRFRHQTIFEWTISDLDTEISKTLTLDFYNYHKRNPSNERVPYTDPNTIFTKANLPSILSPSFSSEISSSGTNFYIFNIDDTALTQQGSADFRLQIKTPAGWSDYPSNAQPLRLISGGTANRIYTANYTGADQPEIVAVLPSTQTDLRALLRVYGIAETAVRATLT